MTFQEFKALRSEGRIVAGISTSTALGLIDYLPKQYQYAHLFWSWIWMLSIPGFILVSIFYSWWVGLLLLVFVTPLIFRATKKSASQFVLAHIEEDEAFFDLVFQRGLLTFRESERSSVDGT